MGHRVIADKTVTDMMRMKYGPRQGLEGPFLFLGGRVLYYDVKEGSYYDPTTDFYVPHDEMTVINNQLINVLRSVN